LEVGLAFEFDFEGGRGEPTGDGAAVDVEVGGGCGDGVAGEEESGGEYCRGVRGLKVGVGFELRPGAVKCRGMSRPVVPRFAAVAFRAERFFTAERGHDGVMIPTWFFDAVGTYKAQRSPRLDLAAAIAAVLGFVDG
jgi:hypothetical protein